MNMSDERVMKWRDAIEFLIKLVSKGDPVHLREGDRINLIDDFRRFLDVEGEAEIASQLEGARSNPALLRPAVEVVLKLVSAAADHKRTEIQVGPTLLVFDGTRLHEDRVPVLSDGKLRDVVADFAAGDLGLAEPWQICRCQRMECGKLFLADRKGQMYCSHKCATAVSSAKYHERKKAKSGGKKNKRGVK